MHRKNKNPFQEEKKTDGHTSVFVKTVFNVLGTRGAAANQQKPAAAHWETKARSFIRNGGDMLQQYPLTPATVTDFLLQIMSFIHPTRKSPARLDPRAHLLLVEPFPAELGGI